MSGDSHERVVQRMGEQSEQPVLPESPEQLVEPQGHLRWSLRTALGLLDDEPDPPHWAAAATVHRVEYVEMQEAMLMATARIQELNGQVAGLARRYEELRILHAACPSHRPTVPREMLPVTVYLPLPPPWPAWFWRIVNLFRRSGG